MRALSRVALALVLGLSLSAGLALAQDAATPEQLKKLYGDALAQLKAAQDRKNELAQQNEQLTAKVAELQKQLDQSRGEALELKRKDAESAEKTFFLRSHYAAWQGFVEHYPELKARWKHFLETDLLNGQTDLPQWTDPWAAPPAATPSPAPKPEQPEVRTGD
jgi:predicted nuclease with TOPRIM domain